MLLLLMAAIGSLVWLIRCGGHWCTLGLVLSRLVIAVAVFAAVATAVAQSMTSFCDGPCTDSLAALYGLGAEIVLVAVTVVAAIAAGVVRRPVEVRQRLLDHPALSLRRVVCDVLALGPLSAAAVVFGHDLGRATLRETNGNEISTIGNEIPTPSAAMLWWLLATAALLVVARVPLPSAGASD